MCEENRGDHQASRLDAVKARLHEIGVQGMTVTEVKGFGRQRGHTEIYRGGGRKVDFVPKVKLEIVADDARAADIIEGIIAAARTGNIGDGKIFVLPLEEVVRIRTGETGAEAV